jgi:hypothetical protein
LQSLSKQKTCLPKPKVHVVTAPIVEEQHCQPALPLVVLSGQVAASNRDRRIRGGEGA